MVGHFNMRTYGVNQEFRFVEGIRLHRKSRQIRNNFRKRPILDHICATFFELPSYISTMMLMEIILVRIKMGNCSTDTATNGVKILPS